MEQREPRWDIVEPTGTGAGAGAHVCAHCSKRNSWGCALLAASFRRQLAEQGRPGHSLPRPAPPRLDAFAALRGR